MEKDNPRTIQLVIDDGSYVDSEEGKKKLAEIKKLFEGRKYTCAVEPNDIDTLLTLGTISKEDYDNRLYQVCPPPSEEAIERNRRILQMRHKMSNHEDNFSKLVSYIDHELAELQGAYIPQDMTEGRVHAAKIKLLQNILKKAEEIEDGR